MSAHQTSYRNRRAVSIENERLRVTVSVEGGHIAEIFDKASGVNPLWSPPWPSIEPSTYSRAQHPEYGNDAESRLLAGILGHNLCLDLFGGPSAEEHAAGLWVHGEGSIVEYQVEAQDMQLTARAHLPLAGLDFERRIQLAAGGFVQIHETVTNRLPIDRPLAWTQHVTIGPPFLKPGATRLVMPARRSKVYPTELGPDQQYVANAEFEWPHAPNKKGGVTDIDVYPNFERSTAVTTHAVDRDRDQGFFLMWEPASRLAFGYVWKREDFPWIALWEENHARQAPPWNGKTLTRGVEFGTMPFPTSRRGMLETPQLFGVPGYRWLGANSSASVDYMAFAFQSGEEPDHLMKTLEGRGMVSAGAKK